MNNLYEIEGFNIVPEILEPINQGNEIRTTDKAPKLYEFFMVKVAILHIKLPIRHRFGIF